MPKISPELDRALTKIADSTGAQVRTTEKVGSGTKRTPMTLSGFCSTATQAERAAAIGAVLAVDPADQHRRCKGAVTNGAGKTWLCRCGCHDGRLICHDCGANYQPGDDGWDPERRRCTDRADCARAIAAAVEHARTHNPLLVQIAEIQREVAEERAVEAKKQAVKRAEERARTEAAPPDPEAVREAIRGRAKVPQRCHCGCGDLTKGGQFCMGHDMKLKGRLFKVARDGIDVPSAIRCATEIVARGWSEAGINEHHLQAARARVAEVGAAQIIIGAVEERYAT